MKRNLSLIAAFVLFVASLALGTAQAIQYGTAVNNARLDAIESSIGTAPTANLYTGALPANCAAAATGTLIATGTLPSDWMAAASAGSKAKAGTWTVTGNANAGAGANAGYFRIVGGTPATQCIQGAVSAQVQLTTNNTTAANSNVLNFAATTGVTVGMYASGTGVPAGATVIATTGTTVTLSRASTAGVANGATVTFGADMTIDNISIANGQVVTINSFTISAGAGNQ